MKNRPSEADIHALEVRLQKMEVARFTAARERDDAQAELTDANRSLSALHEVLERKNAIIRLLSLGDLATTDLE
jgi:hypothetical protein